MSLDWLWPDLNDEEGRELRAALAAFDARPPDRRELIQYSNNPSIADLEKRFLRASPAQLVDKSLRRNVLVCTVGLRPMPVILSTLIIEPKKLYLLHSQDSRQFAEQVRDDPYVQRLGLDPVRDIVLRRISLTNAPENYRALQEIVRENPGQQVVVDVSGGVKVMGVALATAAFWLRLPVVYMLGHEVEGIIEPFSERLTSLENPFTFFGSPDIRSIANLFSLGEYDAAIKVCENLRETVGDVRTLGTLDILVEFLEIYRDWDLFTHSIADDVPARKLATRLRVVAGKMERLQLQFADAQALQHNQMFLDQLEATWIANKRNNSEPYRLVDVFAAAQRRAKVGKFDDAVARCYRCLEMAASVTLLRDCQIGDTKNPDLNYFYQRLGPETAFRDAFKRLARYDPKPENGLGLKDQMVLLGLSDQPAHRAIFGNYASMEKENLMEMRNRSTLAHGTIPVTADAYRRFEQRTRGIIDHVFPKGRFEELLNQANHPQLLLQP